MRSHWHHVFVEERIKHAIETLRWHGIGIEYSEDVGGDLAMGHFEDSSGLIQSCCVWNKEEMREIFFEIGEAPQTCIVLRGKFFDFERKLFIIRKSFRILRENCKTCKGKMEEKV